MDPWAAEFRQYLWEDGRGKDVLLKIRKCIKLVVASPHLFDLRHYLAPCFGCLEEKRGRKSQAFMNIIAF